MFDFFTGLFKLPIGHWFILAGLIFLGIAVVGQVAGKMDPGTWGRIMAALLGSAFLVLGLIMYASSGGEGGAGGESTPELATAPPATAVPPTITPMPATAVPTATPLPPTATSAVIPMPQTRQRVSFNIGSASDSFTASLVPGQSQGYVLNIMARQRMYITVNNDTRVLVLDTQDNQMTVVAVDYGQWYVDIPQSGDYTVVLYGSGDTFVTIYIPPL